MDASRILRERSAQAIDAEKKARDRRRKGVEEQRQRSVDWAKAQEQWISIAAQPHGPTNPTAQWGNAMTVEKLRDILAQISPQLKVSEIPHDPGYWSVYRVKPEGAREHLVPFGPALGGIIPEYSVMQTGVVELPHVVNRMDRDTPATLKADTLGQEILRGWRTILVRLVLAGVGSPELIERLVGPSPRASWAALLKKRTDAPLYF